MSFPDPRLRVYDWGFIFHLSGRDPEVVTVPEYVDAVLAPNDRDTWASVSWLSRLNDELKPHGVTVDMDGVAWCPKDQHPNPVAVMAAARSVPVRPVSGRG